VDLPEPAGVVAPKAAAPMSGEPTVPPQPGPAASARQELEAASLELDAGSLELDTGSLEFEPATGSLELDTGSLEFDTGSLELEPATGSLELDSLLPSADEPGPLTASGREEDSALDDDEIDLDAVEASVDEPAAAEAPAPGLRADDSADQDSAMSLELDSAASLELDSAMSLELDATASQDLAADSLELDSAASLELDSAASLELDSAASLELDSAMSLELDSAMSLELDSAASQDSSAESLELDPAASLELDAAMSLELDAVSPRESAEPTPGFDAAMSLELDVVQRPSAATEPTDDDAGPTLDDVTDGGAPATETLGPESLSSSTDSLTAATLGAGLMAPEPRGAADSTDGPAVAGPGARADAEASDAELRSASGSFAPVAPAPLSAFDLAAEPVPWPVARVSPLEVLPGEWTPPHQMPPTGTAEGPLGGPDEDFLLDAEELSISPDSDVSEDLRAALEDSDADASDLGDWLEAAGGLPPSPSQDPAEQPTRSQARDDLEAALAAARPGTAAPDDTPTRVPPAGELGRSLELLAMRRTEEGAREEHTDAPTAPHSLPPRLASSKPAGMQTDIRALAALEELLDGPRSDEPTRPELGPQGSVEEPSIAALVRGLGRQQQVGRVTLSLSDPAAAPSLGGPRLLLMIGDPAPAGAPPAPVAASGAETPAAARAAAAPSPAASPAPAPASPPVPEAVPVAAVDPEPAAPPTAEPAAPPEATPKPRRKRKAKAKAAAPKPPDKVSKAPVPAGDSTADGKAPAPRRRKRGKAAKHTAAPPPEVVESTVGDSTTADPDLDPWGEDEPTEPRGRSAASSIANLKPRRPPVDAFLPDLAAEPSVEEARPEPSVEELLALADDGLEESLTLEADLDTSADYVAGDGAIRVDLGLAGAPPQDADQARKGVGVAPVSPVADKPRVTPDRPAATADLVALAKMDPNDRGRRPVPSIGGNDGLDEPSIVDEEGLLPPSDDWLTEVGGD